MNLFSCVVNDPLKWRTCVRWIQRMGEGLLIACAALLIAACGGGVGTGGTGTYAAGPISGFGSIIVGGVRYDETQAAITDDLGRTRSIAELKLGAMVEVEAGSVLVDASGAALAKAQRVRLTSDIVGPVTALDLVAGRLTVLGQDVRVAADTVFDARLPAGLASLLSGTVVEVYARYDASSNAYMATRLEVASDPTAWKIRGTVTSVDPASGTLRIGNTAVVAPGGVAAGLTTGQTVRLQLQSSNVPGAAVQAIAASGAERKPGEGSEVRLSGLVTSWMSAALFSVDGVLVDASTSTFPNGQAGLKLGARVEVRGTALSAQVRAAEVRVEAEDAAVTREFDFKGPIEAVDARTKTFVLRGTTISYDRTGLRLEGGTESDLTVGRSVEVKAVPSAKDRSRVEAIRIVFK
ncbi:MAG: DUF5666 domain-containing protein [Betaproteobacteria bacterium]